MIDTPRSETERTPINDRRYSGMPFGVTRCWRLGILVVALCVSLAARANDDDKKDDKEFKSVTLMEENDCLYTPWRDHQDRHYTQGAKIIWAADADDDGCLTKFVKSMPRLGIDDAKARYAWSFGQNIYTPGNFIATNLIRDDRPYAGWIYLGAALQRRGEVGAFPVMESLDVDFGFIGPQAQGGRAQNEVHLLEGFHTFDGWNNQLRNEPDFVFKYARAYRMSPESMRNYFDFTPMVGANLGTLMVSGSLSATMRFGINLPDDFGVQTIDSPMVSGNGPSRGGCFGGAYIFGRVEGRAVGHNVFLDGNNFVTSFHIDKEPLVADFVYGAAFNLSRYLEIGYTYTIRTDEFVGQRGNDRFGSVMVMWKCGF
jgi:lipid A 3-O-deacylase